MPKIVAFQIEIGGIQAVVTDLNNLKAAIIVTQKELNKTKFGTAEFAKLEKQLGSLKQVQADFNKQVQTQNREFVIAQDTGKRSYRAINAELVNLRNSFKELSEVERKGRVGQDMLKNIRGLDSELKKIDSSIGNFQRNVGNYRSALTGLGDLVTGGLITGGIVTAFSKLSDGIGEAIQQTAGFNRQIGFVKAVSGATDEELQTLRRDALEFGTATEFSATQVAGLQIEYSKLGFTAQEIRTLLPASLDTATVSAETLQRTAEVLGVSIRAFGFDVSESTRLADVLAKAFAATALDLGKFDVAVSTVGAVASATGTSLEEMTALMGVLSNAGFDASVAATSLRNIFLENAQAGQTMDEALRDIANSENALVTAFDKYGKRGAAAAVVLSKSTQAVAELQAVLEDSEGFSKSAAATVRSDLKGAFDKLRGALVALKIGLVDTFGTTLQTAIENLASFARFWGRVLSGETEATKKFQELKDTFTDFLPLVIGLTTAYAALNVTQVITIANTIRYRVVQLASAVATGIMTAAQWALNVAMTANPIGLVVAGISILVGAFITAYKSSETFRQSVNGLWEVIKELNTIVRESFTAFGDAFTALGEGRFKDFAIKMEEGLRKSNPIGAFVGQGQRLKDAYARGYEQGADPAIKSDADAIRRELEIENQTLIDTAQGAGREVGSAWVGEIEESVDNTLVALKARRKSLKSALADLSPDSDAFDETLREYQQVNGQIKAIEAQMKGTTGAIVTSFDRLTQKQTELQSQIKSAIVTGKDYSGLLKEYLNVTKELIDAENEYKITVENAILTYGLAQNSIELLSKQVSILRDELEQTTPDNIDEVVAKLIDAQKKLDEANRVIERASLPLENTQATGVLEFDIEPAIRAINEWKGTSLLAVKEIVGFEQVAANERKAIELSADIAILTERLKLWKEGTDERLKIELDLKNKRLELEKIEDTSFSDKRIAEINEEKNKRIEAARLVARSEIELYKQANVIRLSSEAEILRVRLNNAKLSADERLKIEEELAQKEIEIQKAKNETINADFKDWWENWGDEVNDAISGITDTFQAISDLQEASTERELSRIDAEYAYRIKRAGDNAEVVENLENERDAKKEQIEKREFERSKRLQIIMALISAAQGVINILGGQSSIPQPFDAIWKAAQIAILAATTAAQIAKINSQTFAQGGFTGEGSAKSDKTGKRPAGIVHANEYVVPEFIINTKRGRELVDELELMRSKKSISPAFNMAGFYASGGSVSPNVIPNIPSASGSSSFNSNATFTDDQIEYLAERLGSAVFTGTRSGTVEGTEFSTRYVERYSKLRYQTK